jgi:hypothetical protein
VVESSALLKRRSPKGYRGFESLPHRLHMKLASHASKLKVKLKVFAIVLLMLGAGDGSIGSAAYITSP